MILNISALRPLEIGSGDLGQNTQFPPQARSERLLRCRYTGCFALPLRFCWCFSLLTPIEPVTSSVWSITAMKRPHSNIVTSPNPEQHKVKKMKTSAPVSQGIVQMTAEESKADADGGEWTKVDKRKVKKMKRTDAKLDVCVSCSAAL